MLSPLLTEPWLDSAVACKPSNTEFFSELPREQAAAKAICYTCPMLDQCRTDHYLDPFTVVGGTTWAERKQALRFGTPPPEVAERLDRAGKNGTLLGAIRHLMYDQRTWTAILSNHGGDSAWTT